MLLLLTELGQATADIINHGAPSGTSQTLAPALAHHASSTLHPVTVIFWALMVLAAVGIYHYMTRRAYPLRRYRRAVSKSPLSRLRDLLNDRVS